MKNLPEHELLSAYLDGELTVGEQARVEQFLAGNPAAHQALDELRSVSMAIGGLPELRLGENLSDRILRQAERAILTGSGEPAAGDKAASPRQGRWSALFRRVVASRGIAWSGAALAIALLIMLSTTPEHGQERDVALAPESPSSMPAPAAKPNSNAIAEMWAAGEPRDGFSRQGVDKNAAVTESQNLADQALEELDRMRAAPVATGPERPAAPAALPGPPSKPAPVADALQNEQPVVESEAPALELAAPRIAPAMPLDAMKEPSQATRQLAAAAQSTLDASQPPAGAAMLRKSEKDDADMAADAPVLIVQCDITPEAAREGAFGRILAAQQIAFREGQPAGERAEQIADDRAGRRKQRLAGVDESNATPDVGVDVVFVEATPNQVADMLDQLALMPDQFLAVSVKPAPGVGAQQALTRFNRRALEPAAKGVEELKRQRRSAAEVVTMPTADSARTADERSTPELAEDAPASAGTGAEAPPPAVGRTPAPEAMEAEPGDPYRVLFVLRVVPPDRLTGPGAALGEPPAAEEADGDP